jgi:hypothetical protein
MDHQQHTDHHHIEEKKVIISNDDDLDENSKDRLDERLDQAGEESFPGSDPVSVKITK